jgi:hypothetical protein
MMEKAVTLCSHNQSNRLLLAIMDLNCLLSLLWVSMPRIKGTQWLSLEVVATPDRARKQLLLVSTPMELLLANKEWVMPRVES